MKTIIHPQSCGFQYPFCRSKMLIEYRDPVGREKFQGCIEPLFGAHKIHNTMPLIKGYLTSTVERLLMSPDVLRDEN